MPVSEIKNVFLKAFKEAGGAEDLDVSIAAAKGAVSDAFSLLEVECKDFDLKFGEEGSKGEDVAFADPLLEAEQVISASEISDAFEEEIKAYAGGKVRIKVSS